MTKKKLNQRKRLKVKKTTMKIVMIHLLLPLLHQIQILLNPKKVKSKTLNQRKRLKLKKMMKKIVMIPRLLPLLHPILILLNPKKVKSKILNQRKRLKLKRTKIVMIPPLPPHQILILPNLKKFKRRVLNQRKRLKIKKTMIKIAMIPPLLPHHRHQIQTLLTQTTVTVKIVTMVEDVHVVAAGKVKKILMPNVKLSIRR